MKNITKILLALIALFVLGGIIISCDQDTTVDATMLNITDKTSPDDTSDDTPDALGKIVIYYHLEDKSLSAWDLSSTDYSVPTGNVQESDFRAIDSLMEGKVIRGLSFEGIKRIEGRFQSDGGGYPLQIRFSSELEYIGENVFRTSNNLWEVEFSGAAPEVEATAFPGSSDYDDDCYFSVPPNSDAASWVAVLKPFISTDCGWLNIISYIRLDANVTTYLDRYPTSFGNPLFSNGETELEGSFYAGRSINDIEIPHDDSGQPFYFTFMGFYAEKDNPVTQVIDAIGESIPNVAGYTDSDGAWIREEATVLYAHWEELLP